MKQKKTDIFRFTTIDVGRYSPASFGSESLFLLSSSSRLSAVGRVVFVLVVVLVVVAFVVGFVVKPVVMNRVVVVVFVG